jgi:hypothetical protein
MKKWRKTAKEIAERKTVLPAALEVFFHVLEHIAEENWHGACHSSSTMLYILLQEYGIDSDIMIGDVKAPVGVFEHSWIEIDGAIFDAAVAFPDLRGKPVGGPIFAGYDLGTGELTTNVYGVGTFDGFTADTKTITWLSIGTYYTWADNKAEVECRGLGYPAPEPLWDRVTRLAQSIGLRKTREDLASEHFEIKRTVRST